MGNFTPEMLEKCKEAIVAAKSADEILALAKNKNIEMPPEKAEELYARYHKSGELPDDDLDNVAGGGCGETSGGGIVDCFVLLKSHFDFFNNTDKFVSAA